MYKIELWPSYSIGKYIPSFLKLNKISCCATIFYHMFKNLKKAAVLYKNFEKIYFCPKFLGFKPQFPSIYKRNLFNSLIPFVSFLTMKKEIQEFWNGPNKNQRSFFSHGKCLFNRAGITSYFWNYFEQNHKTALLKIFQISKKSIF